LKAKEKIAIGRQFAEESATAAKNNFFFVRLRFRQMALPAAKLFFLRR